ncbi:hypothetical protein JNUCC64_30590 [Streptomyces sp. JNUCC 64]
MTTAEFRPTHVVPPGGLPTWEVPDPARPSAPLDALLPVRLTDRLGDWGRVVCANGWTAWVDGRLLVAVPGPPPEAGSPTARTADPRPLLARAEEAVTRYRAAVAELADGTLDTEGFQRNTRGLRVGVVVDGESLWLYDADHERWVHCDGRRISGFATDRAARADTTGPSGTGPSGPSGTGPQWPERPERPGREDGRAGSGRDPTAVAPPPGAGPAHPPTRVVTPEEYPEFAPEPEPEPEPETGARARAETETGAAVGPVPESEPEPDRGGDPDTSPGPARPTDAGERTRPVTRPVARPAHRPPGGDPP